MAGEVAVRKDRKLHSPEEPVGYGVGKKKKGSQYGRTWVRCCFIGRGEKKLDGDGKG